MGAETQTRKNNTKLAVYLAREDTRRSPMTDGRATVVVSMDCLGTAIEAIVVWMADLIYRLQVNFTALIQHGSRAACEEHINFSAADFTDESVDTSAGFRTRSVPSGEVVLTRSDKLMDFEVIPFP